MEASQLIGTALLFQEYNSFRPVFVRACTRLCIRSCDHAQQRLMPSNCAQEVMLHDIVQLQYILNTTNQLI